MEGFAHPRGTKNCMASCGVCNLAIISDLKHASVILLNQHAMSEGER